MGNPTSSMQPRLAQREYGRASPPAHSLSVALQGAAEAAVAGAILAAALGGPSDAPPPARHAATAGCPSARSCAACSVALRGPRRKS